MGFKPCFKVYNLASAYPKGMKLGQMTNLSVIVYVALLVYRLVTIQVHRPSSLLNFEMACCTEFWSNCCFPNLRLTTLLPYNSKGLFFDLYDLSRKDN